MSPCSIVMILYLLHHISNLIFPLFHQDFSVFDPLTTTHEKFHHSYDLRVMPGLVAGSQLLGRRHARRAKCNSLLATGDFLIDWLIAVDHCRHLLNFVLPSHHVITNLRVESDLL